MFLRWEKIYLPNPLYLILSIVNLLVFIDARRFFNKLSSDRKFVIQLEWNLFSYVSSLFEKDSTHYFARDIKDE